MNRSALRSPPGSASVPRASGDEPVSVESRADLSSTMRLAVAVADGRAGTREPAEGDLTLVSMSAVWGLAFWDAFEWSRVYTPRARRALGVTGRNFSLLIATDAGPEAQVSPPHVLSAVAVDWLPRRKDLGA